MSGTATSTWQAKLQQAKARLSDMQTQEVSLVDAAANLRRWVITKRNEGAMALKLPSTAKQSIMDGLAAGLDQLTALATMVGEAETADGAQVPDELGAALKQCADTVSGLAAQYNKKEAAANPAPTTTPAGATPAPAPAAGEPAEKAGRKIAGARFNKLVDVHAALGGLIDELKAAGACPECKGTGKVGGDACKACGGTGMVKAEDDEPDGDEEKRKAKQPPPPPPPAGGGKPKGEDDEEEDKAKKALSKADDALSKLKELGAKVDKALAQPQPSNARPVEGAGPAGDGFKWPVDLSAHVAQKRAGKTK